MTISDAQAAEGIATMRALMATFLDAVMHRPDFYGEAMAMVGGDSPLRTPQGRIDCVATAIDAQMRHTMPRVSVPPERLTILAATYVAEVLLCEPERYPQLLAWVRTGEVPQ